MLVNPLLRTCAKQQLTIIISWVSFAFAQMGIAQISKIVLLVYEYVARSVARSSESPFKNIRRENKSHPFHHLCQLVINQSLIHHLAVTEQLHNTCVLNPTCARAKARMSFRRYLMKPPVSYGELHLPVVNRVVQWKARNYWPCCHPRKLAHMSTCGERIGLIGNQWQSFSQIFSEINSALKFCQVIFCPSREGDS